MNKIYLSSVLEYTGCVRTKILETHLFDSLEEGIEYGKDIIKEYCTNHRKESNDIRYEISISVVSKNRIKFNTSCELVQYYENNINNISNEELYDFLLSIVDNDTRFYDYNGNYISNFIFEQQPKFEFMCMDIYFNEEDCKKGIYTFRYPKFYEDKQ